MGWGGEVELNGAASAAYHAAQWSNVTATVSADSMRGEGLDDFGLLNDVTADGSGVWTYVRLSGNTTTTYTPERIALYRIYCLHRRDSNPQ